MCTTNEKVTEIPQTELNWNAVYAINLYCNTTEEAVKKLIYQALLLAYYNSMDSIVFNLTQLPPSTNENNLRKIFSVKIMETVSSFLERYESDENGNPIKFEMGKKSKMQTRN